MPQKPLRTAERLRAKLVRIVVVVVPKDVVCKVVVLVVGGGRAVCNISLPPVVGSAAQDMRHLFVLVRTLLEARGSFLSLDRWFAAAEFGQDGARKVGQQNLNNALRIKES